MDWNDLGKVVGPILINNAPTIGSVLGGLIPMPGGSIIGEQMGNVLASVFGTPPGDPRALANAIQSDPNAAAKITAAETEAQARWPALAEIAKAQFAANVAESTEINTTIRAEVAKGQPPWAWRNLYGYSVALEMPLTFLIFFYGVIFSPEVFTRFMASTAWLNVWFPIRLGLLGYIHNQSSNEKIAAATGQPPSGIVASVVRAVKGK